MSILKKTLILGLSVGFITTNVLAASATTTSTKNLSTLEKLKKSKFKTTIYSESNLLRDGTSLQGISSLTEFIFGYNQTKKDAISLKMSTAQKMSAKQDATSNYNYTELRYMKKQILTEKENGIGLSVQGRVAAYAPKYRTAKNTAGYAQARAYLSKSFLDKKFSTTLLVAAKVYSAKIQEGVLKRRDYAQLVTSYQLSDKVSVGVDTLILHDEMAAGTNVHNTLLVFYPSVSFQATKNLGITFFIESLATDENDAYAGFRSDLFTASSYNLAVNYNIF